MRRLIGPAILALLLCGATTALADFGFGVEWLGGASVLNASRIYTTNGSEQSGSVHGDGIGWFTGPQLLLGYRTKDYFAGAELGYAWHEVTLNYDEFDGEKDFDVRRRADVFRVGGVFNYFFLEGKARPFLLVALDANIIEASLRRHGAVDRSLLDYDSSLGGGLGVGVGADFRVDDRTAIGVGVRGDFTYAIVRRGKDRTADEFVQFPVGLFVRVNFDFVSEGSDATPPPSEEPPAGDEPAPDESPSDESPSDEAAPEGEQPADDTSGDEPAPEN